MNNTNYFLLSELGFKDKYIINSKGEVFDTDKKVKLKLSAKNNYSLRKQDGTIAQRSLKNLYRSAFGKEYCIDTIINLPNEEWKEIQGTQGKYFVSNKARVKSYCGYTAKILSPCYFSNGYVCIKLFRKNRLLHRLVAEAFVFNDNPSIKKTVNHIDCNKDNNLPENLEWCSLQENIIKYYKVKESYNETLLSKV